MSAIYKEKYFNRRNWILDNISNLRLSAEETVVLLMIDFYNEFNVSITIEKLVNSTCMSSNVIDDCISKLCSKGFLTIRNEGLNVYFDIDSIFTYHSSSIVESDLYELFENEFGRVLSQKEITMISEWTRIYDTDSIVNALREASINEKKSINYIEKILSNNEKTE